ncbi:MAG: AAC(3) family N-acetyltransferase [Anaerolineae bacterium]
MSIKSYFPVDYQAVLLRCWNRIPLEALAVLCSAAPEQVQREGLRLGLPAWQEPEPPAAIRDTTYAESTRIRAAKEFISSLGAATQKPKDFSDLLVAFAQAQTKAEKNRLASSLRSIAAQALDSVRALVVEMAGLPELGLPLPSMAFYDLYERALYYRYLEQRVYAPFVDRGDIADAMRALGIRPGDLMLMHSSYTSLGNVIGGAQAVIDGIRDVLGPEGTLALPTLSMRRFANAYRDWYPERPSDTGYLTEYFRQMPGVLRSNQATHSVAALGRLAYELTFEHTARGPRTCVFGEYAFSQSSPWQKLYDLGGKVVFLGVDMNCNTLKHLIEARLVENHLNAVPDLAARERLREGVWKHEQYNQLTSGSTERMWPFYDGLVMQEELDQLDLIAHTRCGNADLMALDVRLMADATTRLLEADLARWYPAHVLRWFAEVDAAAAPGWGAQ